MCFSEEKAGENGIRMNGKIDTTKKTEKRKKPHFRHAKKNALYKATSVPFTRSVWGKGSRARPSPQGTEPPKIYRSLIN